MKTTTLFALGLLGASSGLACSSAHSPSNGGSGGGAGGSGAGSPSSTGGGADAGSAASDAGSGGTESDAGTAQAPDAGPVQGTVNYVSGASVSTLAGSGVAGTQDGSGAAAQFDNPAGIAVDTTGNLLVVDYDSARVRLVTPAGVVTTLAAGTGFVDPFSVVVAGDGTYYVGTDADTAGAKSATSGTVWRVPAPAGSSPAMPVVVAQGFGRARGLAPIAGGGSLFVADRYQDVVDQVTASGTITVLAGALGSGGFNDATGTAAQFSGPIGVAAMPAGAGWLVADSNNNRIRLVTAAGVVTTFAGTGEFGINDGPKAAAVFYSPRAIAVDGAGNAYVSDIGNHRIRRIRVDGTVDTIAGDGTQGFLDGSGASAEFYGQEGIAVSGDGKTVYVADGNGGDGSGYHRVRAIAVPAAGGV